MPPAIPDKIPCESVESFGIEIVSLREALSYPETEETWDRIARALTRFGAVVKGGGYKFERELINGVKASSSPIINALNSDRTRLSAAAIDCISTVAPRIGLAFETLVPLFIPHILRLATRPNKVYVTRSQATLQLVLGYCHIPNIIPQLLLACKESKLATGRAVALEGVSRCLNKWDWTQRDIRGKVGDIEEIIRLTGRDKDAGIRQTSRKVFEAYKTLFPERLEEFTGPLTPVMKKYLDIKPLPKGNKLVERALERPPAENTKRHPAKSEEPIALSSSASRSTRDDRGAPLARSTSSNMATGSSTAAHSNHIQNYAGGSQTMAPPARIPAHAPTLPHSRDLSHAVRGEEKAPDERQRVLSTASSTFSIKSAPPLSRPGFESRAPVGMATSKDHPSRPDLLVAGSRGRVISSGHARRVRKVVPVESHPASRADPVTLMRKAPAHTPNSTGNGVPHASGVAQSATAVVFPSSESANPAPFERRGAQRVPKPVLPPPVPATPPKVRRPATATGVVPKGEVKQSLFRRVPGAPVGDAKQVEKKQQGGFVPRRGGGVTQPTLSQLNKQKAPASINSQARSVSVSSRPGWGISKTGTKGLPASKAQVRPPLPKASSSKHVGKLNAYPTSLPLPTSPRRDMGVQPQLIPLPASPVQEIPDGGKVKEEVLLEVGVAEEMPTGAYEGVPEATTVPQVPEITLYENEALGNTVPVESVVDAVHEDNAERTIRQMQPDGGPEIVPQDNPKPDDIRVPGEPHIPQTPPYPSIDEESEGDDLDDIEFANWGGFAPNGSPLKTAQKVASLDVDAIPGRNPLGEVVLNG